eukprot:scaffold110361_cov15-Tisochrysis_lutea.AAC.4
MHARSPDKPILSSLLYLTPPYLSLCLGSFAAHARCSAVPRVLDHSTTHLHWLPSKPGISLCWEAVPPTSSSALATLFWFLLSPGFKQATPALPAQVQACLTSPTPSAMASLAEAVRSSPHSLGLQYTRELLLAMGQPPLVKAGKAQKKAAASTAASAAATAAAGGLAATQTDGKVAESKVDKSALALQLPL